MDDIEGTIRKLREEYQITNKKLLIQCGIILALTIFLFIVHGKLKMEPSIAALTGAALLMVISRENIVEMLEKEIEWPTLIFFMMLFIVVAAAEHTGLIQIIADWVRDMSRGSLVIAVIMILWVSAFASAIIDNIPFTATMLPIVAYLTQVIPGAESGCPVVGACARGMPRRERHHDRGQRQRGHRRHGREGGLSHLLHGVSQGGLHPDGHHGVFEHDLAACGGDLISGFRVRYKAAYAVSGIGIRILDSPNSFFTATASLTTGHLQRGALWHIRRSSAG